MSRIEFLNAFSVFLSSLFDAIQKIDDPNASMIQIHVLKNFPNAWKIDARGIKSNVIQKLVYENFYEWGQGQSWDEETRQNERFIFDKVVKYVFLKNDPILWGRFFDFAWSPWFDDERVKFFIEREWRIGMMGRSRSGTNLTDQVQETIELVRLLPLFEKTDVERFIRKAKSLKVVYDDNVSMQNKRAEVQRMFELLLEHMSKF